ALKNRDFLYTARVWNLDQLAGNCGLCAKNCSTRVDTLKGEVTRVMARENPNVNDYWVCDRGRLDFKWINSAKRIDLPQTKTGSVSWARGCGPAATGLRAASAAAGRSWAIASGSRTNEELFLLRKLTQRLGISNIAV